MNIYDINIKTNYMIEYQIMENLCDNMFLFCALGVMISLISQSDFEDPPTRHDLERLILMVFCSDAKPDCQRLPSGNDMYIMTSSLLLTMAQSK